MNKELMKKSIKVITSTQVLTMAELIYNHNKIVHHGGRKCYIAGKEFQAKHLQFAKRLLWLRRKNKKWMSLSDVQTSLREGFALKSGTQAKQDSSQ